MRDNLDRLMWQPSAERIASLRNSYGEAPESIAVASAFALTDDQRHQLGQALVSVAGPDIPLHFEQNAELMAGVRITIGAWLLGANLQDELAGFAVLAHGE